jgi:hypothetical protein
MNTTPISERRSNEGKLFKSMTTLPINDRRSHKSEMDEPPVEDIMDVPKSAPLIVEDSVNDRGSLVLEEGAAFVQAVPTSRFVAKQASPLKASSERTSRAPSARRCMAKSGGATPPHSASATAQSADSVRV